jgi:probable rRNA maturation factor
MATTPEPAITVELQVSDGCPPVDIERITHLLTVTARRYGMRGELGVWICNDSEIANLHVQFMQIEGPTDVMTFPDDSPASGGYLGDIVVSFETAATHANDAGHSVEREIAFLCLHGMLHLAGYNDLEDDARDTMLRQQEELLNDFERRFPGEWTTRNHRKSDPHYSE